MDFRFTTYTPEVEERLAQILKELPIRAIEEPGNDVHVRENVALIGSLTDVLERLSIVVDADFKDLLSDPERCYDWEYEFVRCESNSSSLAIYTRLHARIAGDGSVRYGRYVRRLSDDAYALWLDD